MASSNTPLRSLHVLTRYLGGGSERDIATLVDFECDRGYEVHVALGADSDLGALPSRAVVHPLPSLRRAVRPWWDAAAISTLRRLIANGDYDVVHTHQSKAGILGRLAARGLAPAIVHTAHMASFGPGYAGPASRVFEEAERRCGSFTDILVTVGAELRERYVTAGVSEPGRYCLVRTPIDIDSFAAARGAAPEARARFRESLHIPAESPLAISVGALESRKRHALTIRALGPLLRDGEVRLAIAGEGPERAHLEQLADQFGVRHRVRMLGHTPEVPSLLACADVVVLASTSEGVPRIVIEALAAGVPVVATDVEGLREVPGAPIDIVEPNGRGLREAVARRIAGERPAPVPLEALQDWQPASVERQMASLHERIARVLERRALLAGVPA